jgi:hypothetical protein
MKDDTLTRIFQRCPLCTAEPEREVPSRDRRLLGCGRCGLIFAQEADRLPLGEAKARYLLHENRIEDKAYCTFLSRSIKAALPFLKPGGHGLDYGCGHGPVLSRLLEREGFAMTDYDPLFFKGPHEDRRSSC